MGQKTLKLMFVCAGNGTGGAEKNFLTACINFFRLGADQAQVVPVVRRNTWLSKRLVAEKIPHYVMPFGGLFDFVTKGRMRKLIKAERPDVVQTWMNRATSMTPKVPGIPLIGRLGGYYKVKNYAHADHLVAIAEGIISYLVSNGWSRSDISLVQNFGTLPPENFTESRDEVRAHYNLPHNAVVLLTASRLHPHKAQDTVIRALPLLPPHIYYLVSATGPDEEMLRALAAQLGVSSRVHFTGWVNNLSPLCAASDIFIVSSRVEPLGSVVLDAWAHNLPLISSNASGPAEIIADGTTGLLYPIDDHVALADRVNLLLSNPSLAQGLAAAGYQHVRTHYAEDAIIAKYLALYRRLIAERGTNT